MTLTGPQVAWVVGARFETEAEAGADSPVAQFVREIGDEHLVLMSPTRFDDAMIRAYLESRPTAHRCTDAQIDLIARFTRGLPLAVSFIATLLDDGQPVEDACQVVHDRHPSTVISQLARRYLVHTEQQTYSAADPRRDDLTKILGLALAFGDLRSDPELLGALRNVPDPLAAFEDLAHRHDFVLPVSRRLHDDVRHTLRTDLLDPYRRARVREINRRAIDLFRARLGQMRSRWPTLDAQLSHTAFTTALLATLWHTLWADNQAGLDLFTQILPVLAAADPSTADAAAAMMGQFADTFDQDQRHDLNLLTKFGPGDFDAPLWPGERWDIALRPAWRVKVTLGGIALTTPDSTAIEPLIGQASDRQAAVMILRAGRQARGRDDGAAVTTLQSAAPQTTSTRLRQAIGTQAHAIANRLIWAGPRGASVPTTTGLAAAKLATDLVPDNALAWSSFGAALDDMGRLEDALDAYDKALALDPESAHIHSNRGNTLDDLGRTDDALAAHDRGLALDPGNAYVHNNRGVTLRHMGRFEEALAAYDKALALDPDLSFPHENKGITLAVIGDLDQALTKLDAADRLAPEGAGEGRTWAGAILWHQRDPAGARDRFALVQGRVSGCTPFRIAEMEAVALCGLGQPDDAERHLLAAVPRRCPADWAEPRVIYDLLSDPPLLGIKRLRAIVDSDS